MKNKKPKSLRPHRYHTKVKRARVIPFGYRQDEFDKHLLQPIPHQLLALAQAMEYLKSCSYENVAKWLTAKTGRYISDVGLWKMKRKHKDAMYDKHYKARLERDKLARKYVREQLTAAKIKEDKAEDIQPSGDCETPAGGSQEGAEES